MLKQVYCTGYKDNISINKDIFDLFPFPFFINKFPFYIKNLIFASSSTIYGEVKKFPIIEDIKPLPISVYGATKVAGDNLLSAYSYS